MDLCTHLQDTYVRGGQLIFPRADIRQVLLDIEGGEKYSEKAGDAASVVPEASARSRVSTTPRSADVLAAALFELITAGKVGFPFKRLCMMDSGIEHDSSSDAGTCASAQTAELVDDKVDAPHPVDEGPTLLGKASAALPVDCVDVLVAADTATLPQDDGPPDVARLFSALQEYVPTVTHRQLPLQNISFVRGDKQKQSQPLRGTNIHKLLHLESRNLQKLCSARTSDSWTFVSRDADYFNVDLLTDWFTEEARMHARRQDQSQSPIEFWSSPSVVDMLRGMIVRDRMAAHKVSANHPEPFRSQLLACDMTTYTLREELYACVKEATTFKVSYAATIYRLLGARWDIIDVASRREAHEETHALDALYRTSGKGISVLDISAGWGDRLLAAIAIDVDAYVATDPNQALESGHRSIMDRFSSNVRDAGRFRVIRKPFEQVSVEELRRAEQGIDPDNSKDADLITRSSHLSTQTCPRSFLQGQFSFDMVFTSPPFFNFELYNEADDMDQSHVRFPDEQQWILGFLLTSLSKAWSVLRVDGTLAIHIVDVYKQKVCLAMCLFVEAFLAGSRYAGVFGSISEESHNRLRPCWVWEKLPRISERVRADAESNLAKYYGRDFAAAARKIAIEHGVHTASDLALGMIHDKEVSLSAWLLSSEFESQIEHGFDTTRHSTTQHKRAIVTACRGDEDAAGVLVLGWSLRKNACNDHADFVCLVSPRTSAWVTNALCRVFGRVILVSAVEHASAMVKIHALRLVEYSRIVLLDCNAVVNTTLGDFWEARHPAGIIDLPNLPLLRVLPRAHVEESLCSRHHGVLGCMLLRPSLSEFERCNSRIRDRRYGGWEPWVSCANEALIDHFMHPPHEWTHVGSEVASFPIPALATPRISLFAEDPWRFKDVSQNVDTWDSAACTLLSQDDRFSFFFPRIREIPGQGILFDNTEPPTQHSGDRPTSSRNHRPASNRPFKRRRV